MSFVAQAATARGLEPTHEKTLDLIGVFAVRLGALHFRWSAPMPFRAPDQS